MLLGTKKGKQKENSVSLFFSSPSMTLNDLKVTISYFGKKNSIFFSALRDQKNIYIIISKQMGFTFCNYFLPVKARLIMLKIPRTRTKKGKFDDVL